MAQSLANIFIHIIFSTKKWQPMILPEIIQELYCYMAGIGRAHAFQVHEIGGIEDHVLLAAFQAAFFFNLTQGDALGCCNFEPFGLL